MLGCGQRITFCLHGSLAGCSTGWLCCPLHGGRSDVSLRGQGWREASKEGGRDLRLTSLHRTDVGRFEALPMRARREKLGKKERK
jgi:hypothetical protein